MGDNGFILELKEVCKIYHVGDNTVHALDHINLAVSEGSYMAICGPSGSGKTTFLNIVGGLDVPTGGTVLLNGTDYSRYTSRQRADFRFTEIGFIFQSFNLVPTLNVFDNIYLGVSIGAKKLRRDDRELIKEIYEMIDYLGLSRWVRHRPDQLSGGQRQRVAIARALVKHPSLVLADEPTASLDSENSDIILGFLRKLHDRYGTTCIISTHDKQVMNHVDEIVRIEDGVIKGDDLQ